MGKTTGFLEFEREEPEYQSVEERLKHFNEFVLKVDEDDLVMFLYKPESFQAK